jgi:hypothetical protein
MPLLPNKFRDQFLTTGTKRTKACKPRPAAFDKFLKSISLFQGEMLFEIRTVSWATCEARILPGRSIALVHFILPCPPLSSLLFDDSTRKKMLW